MGFDFTKPKDYGGNTNTNSNSSRSTSGFDFSKPKGGYKEPAKQTTTIPKQVSPAKVASPVPVPKMNTQSKPVTVAERFGPNNLKPGNTFDPSSGKVLIRAEAKAKPETILGKIAQSWQYGQGQKLVNEGLQQKIAQNNPDAGYDIIAKGLRKQQENSAVMADRHEYESLGKAIKDPNFYAVNLTSQLPLSAGLMATSIAGGLAGNAAKLIPVVGPALGTGAQAGVAALTGDKEAKMEAADTYQEVFNDQRKAGKDENEAHNTAMAAADLTYKANLGLLTATNLAEQMTIFGKPLAALEKAGKLGKVVEKIKKVEQGSKLGRVGVPAAVVGGKVIATGAQEGAEEGAQYGIQQWAQNKRIDFSNPEAKESMLSGAVMGGAMAGVGGTAGAMLDRKAGRVKEQAEAAKQKPVQIPVPVPVFQNVKPQQVNEQSVSMEPNKEEIKQQIIKRAAQELISKTQPQAPETVYHKASGKPLEIIDQSSPEFYVVTDEGGKSQVVPRSDVTFEAPEQAKVEAQEPIAMQEEVKQPQAEQVAQEKTFEPNQDASIQPQNIETSEGQIETGGNLQKYADEVVGKGGVKSVTLVGSSVTNGKGNDVDILYDFGERELPSDSDEAAAEVESIIESMDIDIDSYDTFIKVGDRYFHIQNGAGREVIENTDYAKEQEGKPVKVLAQAAEVKEQPGQVQAEPPLDETGIEEPEIIEDIAKKKEEETPPQLTASQGEQTLAQPEIKQEPEVKAEEPSQIDAGDFTITKTKHTRTNEDLWVVKPKQRLSQSEFKELSGRMKQLGGSWSRFTHGFNFKEEPGEKLKALESKKEPVSLAYKPGDRVTWQDSKGRDITGTINEFKQGHVVIKVDKGFYPGIDSISDNFQAMDKTEAKKKLKLLHGEKAEQPDQIEQNFSGKLGRTGNAMLKKWAANEHVYVNLNDPNDSEAQKFIKFFTRYYQAGFNGERIIDIPQADRNIDFPPFLETAAMDAGKKDAERLQVKAISKPEKREEAEASTNEIEVPQNDLDKTTESGINLEKEQDQNPSLKIADFVKQKLTKGQKITNKELWQTATQAYGGGQAEGKFTPKDAYDAMELGVNKWLLDQEMLISNKVSIEEAKNVVGKLQKVLDLLPTQSNRTTEMDEFQQFSTPPSIAYIASWVANMNSKDTVLEPSAGIGGLATFGKIAGAKVIVNELSERRATVIKELGFDQVFTENAEQLNNILPKSVKATVVIMNPPFSSTAGRTKGKNDTRNAIAHIEQALKRLEPNGRLVAIVGRGMANSAPTFRDWWNKLRKEYTVQANIGINGNNYTKYGTSFDVQIVVIDKIGPNKVDTVIGRVDTLEDILPRLERIRNDRPEIMDRSDKGTESAAGQSTGPKTTPESQTGSRSESPIPVSTDRVGTGERESGHTGHNRSTGKQPSGGSDRADNDQSGTAKGNGSTDETRPGTGSTVARPEGVTPGENTNGSSAISERHPEKRPAKSDTTDTGRSSGGIKVEVKRQEGVKSENELTDAVYSEYVPQKLQVPGAKPHPADLVQSSAMASVEPPTPAYKPNLPQAVIKEGKLSLAQIESVVYAGQSHQEALPDGQRRGFFIGDGTGVGKGREISAIILDNVRQGRKKHVWVSINKALLKDAQRDYGDIGGDSSVIFDHGKIKNGNEIAQKEGIIFTTYTTLGTGQNVTATGDLSQRNAEVASRLDQLVQWLGEDFDGVIAFDESHQMQNSLAMKGKRGTSKPAAMALAGVELQARLPNARVVYVSATGATEVENLAYCDRLGLWGTGTPFANKRDFVSKVKSGGLAAMELVARDMKSMGMYIARNIGFNGVTYNTLEHKLTKEQTTVYDAMAEGWQIVLQNINEALAETGAVDADTGATLNPNAKKNAMGAFWGAQQRFFNQILTSMQMPSAIKAIKQDVQDGKSVVVQLVNTNEAQLNRALNALEEGQTIEDLDMTPRGQLMMFLNKSFPIWQYEKYEDENGNIKSRSVLDSMGNMVVNQDALAMKEELMAKVGSMKVPDGPLEILLNELGAENVAEITGRSRRVVRFVNDDTGRWEKKTENRSKNDMSADEKAFMDDRKQILVFSNAGGTGRSYHADRTKKNQRPRKHYLLQAGWTASTAVQGFGRTHRSNQASAPEYVLVTTDLKGQKRFMSSIARRLDQLGALTKGQRSAAGQGLFTEKDNLEGPMASDALASFYSELARNRIAGLNPRELFEKMGLTKLVDEYSNLKEDPEARNVPKFLNRLLSLESSLQNQVFDEFAERLEGLIDQAIANGTIDIGMENFKADKAVVINETTVFTDDRSQAETNLVEFEAYHKTKALSFKEAQSISQLNGFMGYFRNTRSHKIYAVRSKGSTTLTNGAIVNSYYLYGQDKEHKTITDEVKFRNGNWERIPSESIESLWEAAIEAMPEYRKQKVHLITGALLPIWDRLPTGKVRVVRVLTDDSRILLGRIIPDNAIEATLRKLGAESANKDLTPGVIVERIMNGHEVTLSNGWRLGRRRVSGENRIELIGDDLYTYRRDLEAAGVYNERVNYTTRFFIPTGPGSADVLGDVIKHRPVVDIFKPGGEMNTTPSFKAQKAKGGIFRNVFNSGRKKNDIRQRSSEEINRVRCTEEEARRHLHSFAEFHGGIVRRSSFRYQPEALKWPQLQTTVAIANLLGLKVIPFQYVSQKRVMLDGCVDDQVIFINTKPTMPAETTSWHELGHRFKVMAPDVYQKIENIVNERLTDFKALQKYYKTEYGAIYSEEDIIEEFISDLVAQAFSKERAFFSVRELKRHLNGFLDEVLGEVRGKVGDFVSEQEQGAGQSGLAAKAQGAAKGQQMDGEGLARKVEFETEQFVKQLDEWEQGKLKSHEAIAVCSTPEVLQKLGAEPLAIIISQDVLGKVIFPSDKGGKHGVPLDLIKQLPQQLYSPIMVFDSKENFKKHNRKNSWKSLVVMTELQFKGKTIMVAVHLSKTRDWHIINDIASVYPRANDYHFISWINDGLLRYQNERKALEWTRLRGLQLPKRNPNRPFNNTILTENDIVNLDDNGKPKFKAQKRRNIFDLKPKTKVEEAPKFTLPDEEVQQRMEAARGVPQETLKEKLKEAFADLYRKGHREFEYLPRIGRFSELRNSLLQLRKQKGVAGDKTLKILDDVTKNLNEYEYDVFTYKVIFDDLAHDFNEEMSLPFGLTADNFEQNKALVDEEASNNPKVIEAVEKRRKAWQGVKDNYIKTQKAVGFKVEDRLKKEDYYRHQVLEYANAKGMMGSGKKLKTPTGRGFLKQREGSSFDINTDYLQAEYEVMAQMIYDSEIAKVVKVVKKNYDIVNQLKRQAIEQNDEGMLEYFQDMIDKYEIDSTSEKLYRKTLNKKQAIAFSQLYSLAAKGELPTGPNGKYEEIVEEMARAYWAAKESNANNEEADEGKFSDRIPDKMQGELFRYLNYLSNQTESEQGQIKARTVYKGMAEKQRMIKNTLGKRYATWESLIPEGYSLWQPRDGHMFFMANSIPEGIAEQLMTGIADEVGISADILKRVMVVGQSYPELVVPEEVALTLENLYKDMKDSGPVSKFYHTLYRSWKQWQLISPRRYFKYNARNFTGDIDAVLAGNPSALKMVPQAWNDLKAAFFSKEKVMSPELQEWFNRGGFETLMQAQEINNINRNREFKHLMESRTKQQFKDKSLAGKAWETTKAGWMKYWDSVRATTDFREALMRYAVFLDYREQMQNNNGKPKNFGASNRDEIMGLSDLDDRAAKLANELLGAYDEVSVVGTWLADNLFPFWRWNEVNFVRYSRLFKNAAQDGKLMAAIAGKTTGIVIRSPYIAWKVGKFVLKAAALMALITVWNGLFFPDEEKELPEDVKERLHIVLGRDSDGKVRYFSRLGALQDFMDWFGMDTPYKTAQDFLSGRKSIKEIAIDIAKQDANKIINAVTPFIKNTGEALAGVKLYPDAFKPMPIRDRWQYLADSFGLTNEYKAMTGKPSPGYVKSLPDLFYYKSDPYETAFWATREEINRWQKKNHKEGGTGGGFTEKGNALYNVKMAIRYQDKEAFEKYLLEYAMLGGTSKGLKQSLQSLKPLYGLSKENQKAFIEQLDAEGRENLIKSIEYYHRVLGGED